MRINTKTDIYIYIYIYIYISKECLISMKKLMKMEDLTAST